MTAHEIAQKLVEYCREGKWEQAYSELYAENVVSIEPAGGPWPEVVKGMERIQEKGKQFESMVEEMHGIEVTDPIVCGDQFSIGMTMDVKMKGMERAKNEEICVYEIRNGKITKEQFFYPMG